LLLIQNFLKAWIAPRLRSDILFLQPFLSGISSEASQDVGSNVQQAHWRGHSPTTMRPPPRKETMLRLRCYGSFKPTGER
jgi:hypothetical protein